MDFYWFSNNIVKQTINCVKDPLAFAINCCLEHRYFSDLLKMSKVIPVYKKGDKHLPQNYRPISINPVLSKVLESGIHEQLNKHFNELGRFMDSQFGFRAGRSTTSDVMEIVNQTLNAFERKESMALSLLD